MLFVLSFRKDHTYKLTNIINTSRYIVNSGEFQLLNDNKLIVFTKQDGRKKNSVSAIIKFNETELVLKRQKSQSFYMVY